MLIDTMAPAERVLDTHLQAVELLRDASHVRNYAIAEWIAALSQSEFTIESITARKLRMDFPVWTARTRTSAEHANAIRSLSPGSASSTTAVSDPLCAVRNAAGQGCRRGRLPVLTAHA